MVAKREALCDVAYAKVNLALHVRERLPDGYHRIETLFAFCQHGDALEIERADELSLAIDGPFSAALSKGSDNLIVQAAERLRTERAPNAGAAIRLTKTLPIASGIGGGSADAGAALRLLARLWSIPQDDAALLAIASDLGADVPACLISQTCRGEGKGEELTAIDDSELSGTAVLLVNPGVGVSTGPVFDQWDGEDRGGLVLSVPLQLDPAWRNDLMPPARTKESQIGDVLSVLESCSGAQFTRMSGSGATCFALFDSTENRDASAREISEKQPKWWLLSSTLR